MDKKLKIICIASIYKKKIHLQVTQSVFIDTIHKISNFNYENNTCKTCKGDMMLSINNCPQIDKLR